MLSMFRLVIASVVFLPGLLFMSEGFADELRPLRVVEGIAEFRLENGMQVLLFPDVSSPKVTVNVTIFVGSRHEGYGEAGMAHLLEHMVFKGTPDHPDIPGSLKQRGAQFNGTTWLDRTNYYETLPASDENLEFALRLEADRMMNSRILAEDLASEMTVVRNEFERGENSPQRVLMQRITSAAFDWHNYGRSTIGNRADIERVPVENLRRFYRRFYQPDNAMLVIAGKFDPAKALQMANEIFGAIPAPERELDRTYTKEPAQDGERSVTVRRVGDVPMAGVLYHIPAGGHPDYAAVDILTSVMASEPAGRLYESLVRRRLSASMGGFSFALHDPGSLMFLAEASEGTDGPTLLQSLVDAVETAAEKPFTAEEVERARAELLKRRELQMANAQSVAIELSDWAAQGDWRLFFLHRDRLESVTPDDINRVAKTYLTRNNRTSGLFEPTAAAERISIPSTPNLAELLKDYRGRAAVAQGEEFDASPAAIEARLQRSELPSGLKVTVLPRRSRGDQVNVRLTLRYGNLQSLNGLGPVAEILPSLMNRGTANRTRQQIADELNNYRARMSVSGRPGTLSVSVQATRDNLMPVLNLMQDVLKNPAFPEEELELVREELIAGISQQVSDPVSQAMMAATRSVSPYEKGDPRYEADMAEQLEQVRGVTRDQLVALYREQLSAAVGELTIVGECETDQVLQVVSDLATDWKSEVEFSRLPRLHVANTAGSLTTLKTPDKSNAAYMAMMTLPMRDEHPDYPALAIGNFILGSGGLSSRLGNRVRQQDGLSYTVQSGLQPSAVDERTSFFVFAISNPENSGQLQTAIREELDRLLKDGITAEELAAAQEGYLQQQQVRRTNNNTLLQMLESYAFIGRDLSYTAAFEQRIQELTVEEVNSALRTHLDPDRLFIVVAGDFDKVQKSGE